jgi:hypothetical protein
MPPQKTEFSTPVPTAAVGAPTTPGRPAWTPAGLHQLLDGCGPTADADIVLMRRHLDGSPEIARGAARLDPPSTRTAPWLDSGDDLDDPA